MTRPNVTLYPLSDVAVRLDVDYEILRSHVRNKIGILAHRLNNRIFMSEDQVVRVSRELKSLGKTRVMSGISKPHDTGTHVSARQAAILVCDVDSESKIKTVRNASSDIATQIGIGHKSGDWRTAPIEIAKADLPILALELHKRGYKVRSEYLPADTQQAIQPPLPISVSRTDETAKLLGLTTEQAAELYLSLAADILERLK